MSAATKRRGVVIVVDDDPEIRALLRELLDIEGFRVIAVGSGQDALEAMERQESPPALVLLDLMMPDMDGLDFRAAQLANPRFAEVPVVVMSGDTRMQEKVEAMQVSEALAKPFELDPLVEIIDRYVERVRPEGVARPGPAESIVRIVR